MAVQPGLCRTSSETWRHVLWLYSPVCVGPRRKPGDRFCGCTARFVSDLVGNLETGSVAVQPGLCRTSSETRRQVLWLYSPVCVGPRRKPGDRFCGFTARFVSDLVGNLKTGSVAVQPGLCRTSSETRRQVLWLYSPVCVGPRRKPGDRFCGCTARFVSDLVGTWRQVLWLYSPVCVGPCRKPGDRLSHDAVDY